MSEKIEDRRPNPNVYRIDHGCLRRPKSRVIPVRCPPWPRPGRSPHPKPRTSRGSRSIHRASVLGTEVHHPPPTGSVLPPASGKDDSGAPHRLRRVLPVHPAETAFAIRGEGVAVEHQGW